MLMSANLRQGLQGGYYSSGESLRQHVRDLIGSRFELHTSRTRSRRLTTCVIRTV